MDRRADLAPGTPVISSDGHTIGQVKSLLPDGKFFQVDCRFAPDLYVPLDAIHDTRDASVHLRVSQVETRNLGWEARPT
jgi:hypothetical protein